VRLSLIIVSDRVFIDRSLDSILHVVKEAVGDHVGEISHYVVPNEKRLIQIKVLEESLRSDIVVVCGGTGLGPRDLSVEAIEPLLEKKLEGFGEIFRNISFKDVGVKTILSRALAGTIGSSLVFVVPGKPTAVRQALKEIILPVAEHALETLRGVSHWGKAEVLAKDKLDIEDVQLFMKKILSTRDPAICIFIGKVKEVSKGKRVLWFKAGINRDSLKAIAEKVSLKYGVKIDVMLSSGTLVPGDTIIVASASAENREKAFAALREFIEEYKREATHEEEYV